jgi:phage baseplate assembly protein W
MDKDILGTGWSFPPRFIKETRNVEMVSAEEDIRQSLGIILGTGIRERFLHPDFGCDLSAFQFKPLDYGTRFRIKSLVSSTLEKYEPRISVESVDLDTSSLNDGKLIITVSYIIDETGSAANLVYPLDLQ